MLFTGGSFEQPDLPVIQPASGPPTLRLIVHFRISREQAEVPEDCQDGRQPEPPASQRLFRNLHPSTSICIYTVHCLVIMSGTEHVM